MARRPPQHVAERILLSQQFTFLAKTKHREKDVTYFLGRAVPFLMDEIEVQHRLHAEFRLREDD